MVEHKGVMVYCEITDGKLMPISAELFGWGKKLAVELHEELGAIIAGNGISNIAKEAVALGADKVYVVDDTLLNDYQTDSYVSVVEKVVNQVMPQTLILGQTIVGRDLAARLAFRLDTLATLDCVDLAIDPGSRLLLKTRPVYGGKAHAVFSYKCFPQIVTVRPKMMSPPEPDNSRQGEVISITANLSLSKIRAKVLKKVPEDVEGVKLEDAQVVVAGGRGIGSAEGFKQLAELAQVLNGAVGASRPPCDNGWIQNTRQIGLTGKIIAPNLYIGVALSGASQHMSGCSSSKNIVAINKDPEANIFRQARLGVVGDWKKVLPAFRDKLKEILTE
jgi:electron transfer flavoprotein alpha subunit